MVAAEMRRRGRKGAPVIAAAGISFLALMIVTGAQPVQRQLVRFEANGVLAALPESVARIELVRGAEILAVSRRGEGWIAPSGILSEEASRRLAAAVRMMRASPPVREIPREELNGADDAAFGLDAPQIVARLYDGSDRLILAAVFGGPNPDGFLQYMRIEGDGRLYLMSRFIGAEWLAALESGRR
jgi:hypothetical protein